MNRYTTRMVLLLLVLAWIVSGCGNGGTGSDSKDGRLQVFASIYPLAFFAEQIGGEYVTVNNVVPMGADPHDFEPTAKDVARMNESDLFLYNGVGLEGWVDKVKGNLDREKTRIVNTSKGIALISAGHHGKEEEEHDHDHGNQDPHIWLDPIRAKQQAANIKDVMVKKDPKHQRKYEENYEQLAQRLDDLHQKTKETVDQAEGRTFIVSHAAFGYLADRYGLNQISVSGLTPSEEPSPKQLREVVETARKHRVKYILFETLVSGKVAQTVQKEIGARPLTLNPLEGLTQQEKSRGEDYFTLMEKNAVNLGKALETK